MSRQTPVGPALARAASLRLLSDAWTGRWSWHRVNPLHVESGMVLRKVIAKPTQEFGFEGLIGPSVGSSRPGYGSRKAKVPKLHLSRLRPTATLGSKSDRTWGASESAAPDAESSLGLELTIRQPPESVPPPESWEKWIGNHPGSLVSTHLPGRPTHESSGEESLASKPGPRRAVLHVYVSPWESVEPDHMRVSRENASTLGETVEER